MTLSSHAKRVYFHLLLFTTFFDPQNALGLRPIFTYSMLPLWVLAVLAAARAPRRNSAMLVFGVLAPLCGFVVYAFRAPAATPLTDTSYLLFAVTYSLVFLLRDAEDQKLFVEAALVIGTVFSATIVLTAFELILDAGSTLREFMLSNEIARVAFREYAGFRIPYVYFYTSTLLMLPMAVLLERFRASQQRWGMHLIFVVMAVTLFLSGTRSHMILASVFVAGYVYVLGPRARYLGYALTFALLWTFRANLGQIVQEMFSRSEGNNDTKLSMTSTYEEIFRDPITVVVGQGYQAARWSPELRSILSADVEATKTELTYIELLRVYGFPLGALQFLLLWGMVRRGGGEGERYKRTTLVGLLLDSTLNPHLFSSYGAVMLAIASSPSVESEPASALPTALRTQQSFGDAQ